MGATETVAKWIVNTSYEDIPPDAIRVANESCFDLLGVILAGSAQPVGQIIQQYVTDLGGAPEATVLASSQRTAVPNAALANGTMGHALDYDDFGGFGHPTVAIFPALLALGEHIGATGRDLMEAYVIGCEVGLAVDHATKYHQNQMHRGFHSTAILGRLAGAAACAKPLHAGLTCRDGVMAAQLAQRGLTAGDQIIEHPVGFTATVIGDGLYDLEEMAEKLGKPFRVQDALIIKKYPCCGGNHAMLDSIFDLMRQHNFSYEDVAHAEVDQSYVSTVMLYTEPDDPLKGKFSAKYNVAAALVDGGIAIDTFTEGKIADPKLQDTMERVTMRVQSKWERGGSVVSRGVPVRITLKDGRVLEHTTPRDQILGAQKNPWGVENIQHKFQVNATLALPPEKVAETINTWSDITQVNDVAGAIQRTLVSGG
jgi:2-methylcitrate dehydratase PrpD